MASTSRERVYQALQFEGPDRAPRNLWSLPWAELHFPEALKKIRDDFPDDFAGAPGYCRETSRTIGNEYSVGRYTDPWGSVFVNLQEGVIGEVKEPLISDWTIDAAGMADHRHGPGKRVLRAHGEICDRRLLPAPV